MASHGVFRLVAGFLSITSASGMRPEKVDETRVQLEGTDDLGMSSCGVGQLVDGSTFGDGKLHFVSECRSLIPSSQCHGLAEELWEGQDLAAKFKTDYDSDFCVKFREVWAAQVSSAFLQTGSDLDASFFWKSTKKKEQGKETDKTDQDEEADNADKDETDEIAKKEDAEQGVKSVGAKLANLPQDLMVEEAWTSGMAEPWVPGCYTGDDYVHSFKVGIAVDHHLAAGWRLDQGSEDEKQQNKKALEDEIRRTVEAASFTTERQFGIKIETTVQYLEKSDFVNACPTNNDGSIEQNKKFGAYKDGKVARGDWTGAGSWFMLTGCKYYYGLMGYMMKIPGSKYHVEYGKTLGSACASAVTVMLFPDLTVPSYLRRMKVVKDGVPIVFLQEFAQTLGASHTSGGSNAGAMATARGFTLKEIWAHRNALQFHTKFRKGEMCNHIERMTRNDKCTALTKTSEKIAYKSTPPDEKLMLVDCNGSSTIFRDPKVHAGVAVCCNQAGKATRDEALRAHRNVDQYHLSWYDALALCSERKLGLCDEGGAVQAACSGEDRFAWVSTKGSWHLAPAGHDECDSGEKITTHGWSCRFAAQCAITGHNISSTSDYFSSAWPHLPYGCSVRDDGKIHYNHLKKGQNNGLHRLVCSGPEIQ